MNRLYLPHLLKERENIRIIFIWNLQFMAFNQLNISNLPMYWQPSCLLKLLLQIYKLLHFIIEKDWIPNLFQLMYIYREGNITSWIIHLHFQRIPIHKLHSILKLLLICFSSQRYCKLIFFWNKKMELFWESKYYYLKDIHRIIREY